MMSVYLRRSVESDMEALKLAFDRSVDFIVPWSFPPNDLQKYVQQSNL